MNMIWLIGFLFTMGILMEDDAGETPWYVTAFCTVLVLFTWPLYLGHLCARFIVPSEDSTDAT